jgi:hypothetical protein
MARIWPREALEQLGRPLNKWDLCPTCGRPAAEHFYNRLTLAELVCPQESVLKTTAAAYMEQVRRNEERDRARRLTDRAPVTRDTRRQPDALAGPRAYFDDDE